jgi:hypothetical protein
MCFKIKSEDTAAGTFVPYICLQYVPSSHMPHCKEAGCTHKCHWTVIRPMAHQGKVQTPPEIPKALQNRAKLNPIAKTVENR